MTVQSTVVSDDTIEVSNQGINSDDTAEVSNQGINSDNSDKVAYSTYKKSLNQLKTQKTENENLKKELDALKEIEAEKEKEELAKKGKFEELEKRMKDENAQLKTQTDSLLKQQLDSQKLAAFRDALPGTILNSSYYAFVETDKIILNEDGTVNPESVKIVVDNFVNSHSTLYTPKNTNKLPTGAPGSGGGLSLEQWQGLSLVEKKKRLHEVKQ